MSEQIGAIHYDLSINSDKFDKQLATSKQKMQALGTKFNSIGQSMTNVGKKMTLGVTLPIVAGAGLAIKRASDLNETINKVDVAFGDSADEVKKWSKTTIDSFGIAGSTAMELASLFGDMGTSMGISTKDASKMSMELTGLAGDLASFKNIGIEEAQTALAGVFTGETESLKRLGIVMTQTQLEQFRLNKGIKKTIKEMSQAELVQLRYAYVMDKTKNAQGDFARTSDGTANQLRITQERFKELSEQIGAKLLPVANKLLTWVQDIMKKFQDLSPNVKTAIMIFAGLMAVLGPLLLVLGSLVSAIGALIPLLASPVFWIFLAVATALAGIAYLIYRNWDRIKPVVDRVVNAFTIAYNWFKDNIFPIIKQIASFIAGQFVSAWNDLVSAFNRLKATIEPYKPQLIMLGKILLGIQMVIAGVLIGALFALIGAFIGVVTIITRVIGWVAKLIAWFVRLYVQINVAMTNIYRSIMGTFSNAGSWLLNAGKQIMNGLLDGIKRGWENVKNFVGGLGDKIKNLKGPIEKDKVLLANEGGAIMQGLNVGLQRGYKDVEKTLTGITRNIQPTFNAGISDNVGTGAVQGSSTNIYGNITIGSKQDADYFLQRLNRQTNLYDMGLAGGV